MNKKGLLPFRWHKRNGSRLVQVLPEQHLAVLVVELSHLNTVGVGVCPVEFLPQPVHCQAIGGDDAPCDYRHLHKINV